MGCAQAPTEPSPDPVQTRDLPDSFTISFGWDADSSGGTRRGSGTYTYEGDTLTAGKRYEYYSNSMGTTSCNQTWVRQQWIADVPCNMTNTVMVQAETRAGVEMLIANGMLTPSGKCGRGSYCYTLS